MARAMLGQSPQGFTPSDGRYVGSETENATRGLPSTGGGGWEAHRSQKTTIGGYCKGSGKSAGDLS